jgi:hypothetical protein
MKREDIITPEYLKQEVTVTLPLAVVLGIASLSAPGELVQGESIRMQPLRYDAPEIGTQGLHGIYAGNVRGFDGEPDGILEVLAEAGEKMPWEAAMKWAESLGGRLPNRRELRVLWANVPELFTTDEYYWSSEQYAGDDDYAWCQAFYDGFQDANHKDTTLRARAVRRIPIE